MNSNILQLTAIRFKCARVLFKVLRIIELNGVHKNSDHNNVIFRDGPLGNGKMPSMKGAHRRNQTN